MCILPVLSNYSVIFNHNRNFSVNILRFWSVIYASLVFGEFKRKIDLAEMLSSVSVQLLVIAVLVVSEGAPTVVDLERAHRSRPRQSYRGSGFLDISSRLNQLLTSK